MILSPITTDQTMLKVLVGPSSTDGLAGQDCDRDFRSIFVTPTADRLRPEYAYDRSTASIAASRGNR
jgi:hypothetical protein